MVSLRRWPRRVRRGAAGAIAGAALLATGYSTLSAHRVVAPVAHHAALVSPDPSPPSPSPTSAVISPTPDESTTHLTYTGVIAGAMVNPVVTCYGLTGGSSGGSQASIVVSGSVAGQNRVVMIPSYLGETTAGGVIEGPIGPNPGTPLPLIYRSTPGGQEFPIAAGWHGDPTTPMYSTPNHGDGSNPPGLLQLDWSTGTVLDADLFSENQSGSPHPGPVAIHLSGRIVCPQPGATTSPTHTPVVTASPTPVTTPAASPPPSRASAPTPTGTPASPPTAATPRPT